MINKFLILMLCLVFLASPILAEDTLKQNTVSDVIITCLNNGYCSSSAVCNVSIFDPDKIPLVTSVSATRDPTGAFYNVTLNASQTSKIGNYCVSGFCKDGSVSGEIDFCLEVTPNGTRLTIQDSFVRIFLMIFFLLLFLGYYKLNDKINYDKWYEGILKKYENRNYVKLILSSIGFNLIKNKISNYYFIILPIMMLITDLAIAYNVNTLSLLFENLLGVYMLGVIMVAFLLLGQAQEFIVNLLEDVGKEKWGIRESGQ